MTRTQIFLRYILPVLLWGLLITGLSSQHFGASFTYRILSAVARFVYPDVSVATLEWLHFALRKTAHVTEYSIFALLLWRALRREAAECWRASWAAATLSVGVGLAVLDELHQSYTRGRTGSPVDVGWDALGLALALVWLYGRQRRAARAGNCGA